MPTLAPLLLSLTLLVPSLAAADDEPRPQVLASMLDPRTYGGRLAELIHQEAFSRLGLRVVIQYYPAARATALAEKGEVAGEVARSRDYQRMTRNLVRVEVPLFTFLRCAYTLKPDLRLAEYAEPDRIEPVDSAEQGLRKLLARRCDLYIDTAREVQACLASMEFRGSGIREAGALESSTIHCYLHTSQRSLVPRLGALLDRMRTEGVIQRYERQLEGLP